MLIGNQYSDNKVYRGIKHYDSLPLLSEDIHEYTDTLYMKTAYIMNNIIGYGTLNSPAVVVSSAGIRLNEPSVVLIDGDVSLIQSDDNVPIISMSQIKSAGIVSGVLCIVGWYQLITSNSTLRNYGGVGNSILPNDLVNEELGMQLTTRYQFRWAPVVLSSEKISADSLTFSLDSRDETGELTGSTYSVTSSNKLGSVFIAPKPSGMSYAESDLYIVPIIKYEYSSGSGSISSASSTSPVATKGSSGFINSTTEPIGSYSDGTTWYNPITREFKTYVDGRGFISNTSTMAFLQYQSVYRVPADIESSTDIVVPIGISELEESDILQVLYEGLTLTPGENYAINYENHTITLLGFTAFEGDLISFTSTKIVEANDITNITATFTSHMASRGSDTVESHVRLSDSIESISDSKEGVAATPKAVYESRLINDTSSGIRYKFGVENGLIYLEEV